MSLTNDNFFIIVLQSISEVCGHRLHGSPRISISAAPTSSSERGPTGNCVGVVPTCHQVYGRRLRPPRLHIRQQRRRRRLSSPLKARIVPIHRHRLVPHLPDEGLLEGEEPVHLQLVVSLIERLSAVGHWLCQWLGQISSGLFNHRLPHRQRRD